MDLSEHLQLLTERLHEKKAKLALKDEVLASASTPTSRSLFARGFDALEREINLLEWEIQITEDE